MRIPKVVRVIAWITCTVFTFTTVAQSAPAQPMELIRGLSDANARSVSVSGAPTQDFAPMTTVEAMIKEMAKNPASAKSFAEGLSQEGIDTGELQNLLSSDMSEDQLTELADRINELLRKAVLELRVQKNSAVNDAASQARAQEARDALVAMAKEADKEEDPAMTARSAYKAMIIAGLLVSVSAVLFLGYSGMMVSLEQVINVKLQWVGCAVGIYYLVSIYLNCLLSLLFIDQGIIARPGVRPFSPEYKLSVPNRFKPIVRFYEMMHHVPGIRSLSRERQETVVVVLQAVFAPVAWIIFAIIDWVILGASRDDGIYNYSLNAQTSDGFTRSISVEFLAEDRVTAEAVKICPRYEEKIKFVENLIECIVQDLTGKGVFPASDRISVTGCENLFKDVCEYGRSVLTIIWKNHVFRVPVLFDLSLKEKTLNAIEGNALDTVKMMHALSVLLALPNGLGDYAVLSDEKGGRELSDIIAGRNCTFVQALSIANSLVQLVHKLHENGLIVREIVPGNIRIDHRGDARFKDLVLSMPASYDWDSDAAGLKPTCFHPGMAEDAPRAEFDLFDMSALRKRPDVQSDIYALGRTLFALFNSVESCRQILATVDDCPLQGQVEGEFDLFASGKGGDKETQIRDSIAKMTVLDKAKRYKTTAEVLSAISLVNLVAPYGLNLNTMVATSGADFEMDNGEGPAMTAGSADRAASFATLLSFMSCALSMGYLLTMILRDHAISVMPLYSPLVLGIVFAVSMWLNNALSLMGGAQSVIARPGVSPFFPEYIMWVPSYLKPIVRFHEMMHHVPGIRSLQQDKQEWVVVFLQACFAPIAWIIFWCIDLFISVATRMKTIHTYTYGALGKNDDYIQTMHVRFTVDDIAAKEAFKKYPRYTEKIACVKTMISRMVQDVTEKHGLPKSDEIIVSSCDALFFRTGQRDDPTIKISWGKRHFSIPVVYQESTVSVSLREELRSRMSRPGVPAKPETKDLDESRMTHALNVSLSLPVSLRKEAVVSVRKNVTVLADRIKEKNISFDEALAIARSAVTLVRDLHDNGLIVRNISPDTLYVDSDGTVSFTDLVLSMPKEYDWANDPAGLKPTCFHPGTVDDAPRGEVGLSDMSAKRKKPDMQSDIYSLGVTLAYLFDSVESFPKLCSTRDALNSFSLWMSPNGEVFYHANGTVSDKAEQSTQDIITTLGLMTTLDRHARYLTMDQAVAKFAFVGEKEKVIGFGSLLPLLMILIPLFLSGCNAMDVSSVGLNLSNVVFGSALILTGLFALKPLLGAVRAMYYKSRLIEARNAWLPNVFSVSFLAGVFFSAVGILLYHIKLFGDSGNNGLFYGVVPSALFVFFVLAVVFYGLVTVEYDATIESRFEKEYADAYAAFVETLPNWITEGEIGKKVLLILVLFSVLPGVGCALHTPSEGASHVERPAVVVVAEADIEKLDDLSTQMSEALANNDMSRVIALGKPLQDIYAFNHAAEMNVTYPAVASGWTVPAWQKRLDTLFVFFEALGTAYEEMGEYAAARDAYQNALLYTYAVCAHRAQALEAVLNDDPQLAEEGVVSLYELFRDDLRALEVRIHKMEQKLTEPQNDAVVEYSSVGSRYFDAMTIALTSMYGDPIDAVKVEAAVAELEDVYAYTQKHCPENMWVADIVKILSRSYKWLTEYHVKHGDKVKADSYSAKHETFEHVNEESASVLPVIGSQLPKIMMVLCMSGVLALFSGSFTAAQAASAALASEEIVNGLFSMNTLYGIGVGILVAIFFRIQKKVKERKEEAQRAIASGAILARHEKIKKQLARRAAELAKEAWQNEVAKRASSKGISEEAAAAELEAEAAQAKAKAEAEAEAKAKAEAEAKAKAEAEAEAKAKAKAEAKAEVAQKGTAVVSLIVRDEHYSDVMSKRRLFIVIPNIDRLAGLMDAVRKSNDADMRGEVLQELNSICEAEEKNSELRVSIDRAINRLLSTDKDLSERLTTVFIQFPSHERLQNLMTVVRLLNNNDIRKNVAHSLQTFVDENRGDDEIRQHVSELLQKEPLLMKDAKKGHAEIRLRGLPSASNAVLATEVVKKSIMIFLLSASLFGLTAIDPGMIFASTGQGMAHESIFVFAPFFFLAAVTFISMRLWVVSEEDLSHPFYRVAKIWTLGALLFRGILFPVITFGSERLLAGDGLHSLVGVFSVFFFVVGAMFFKMLRDKDGDDASVFMAGAAALFFLSFVFAAVVFLPTYAHSSDMSFILGYCAYSFMALATGWVFTGGGKDIPFDGDMPGVFQQKRTIEQYLVELDDGRQFQSPAGFSRISMALTIAVVSLVAILVLPAVSFAANDITAADSIINGCKSLALGLLAIIGVVTFVFYPERFNAFMVSFGKLFNAIVYYFCVIPYRWFQKHAYKENKPSGEGQKRQQRKNRDRGFSRVSFMAMLLIGIGTCIAVYPYLDMRVPLGVSADAVGTLQGGQSLSGLKKLYSGTDDKGRKAMAESWRTNIDLSEKRSTLLAYAVSLEENPRILHELVLAIDAHRRAADTDVSATQAKALHMPNLAGYDSNMLKDEANSLLEKLGALLHAQKVTAVSTEQTARSAVAHKNPFVLRDKSGFATPWSVIGFFVVSLIGIGMSLASSVFAANVDTVALTELGKNVAMLMVLCSIGLAFVIAMLLPSSAQGATDAFHSLRDGVSLWHALLFISVLAAAGWLLSKLQNENDRSLTAVRNLKKVNPRIYEKTQRNSIEEKFVALEDEKNIIERFRLGMPLWIAVFEKVDFSPLNGLDLNEYLVLLRHDELLVRLAVWEYLRSQEDEKMKAVYTVLRKQKELTDRVPFVPSVQYAGMSIAELKTIFARNDDAGLNGAEDRSSDTKAPTSFESFFGVKSTPELDALVYDEDVKNSFYATVREVKALMKDPRKYENVRFSALYKKLGLYSASSRASYIHPAATQHDIVLKATLVHEHVHYLLGTKYGSALTEAIAGLVEARFLMTECVKADQRKKGAIPGETLTEVLTFLKKEGSITAPLLHLLNGFVRYEGNFEKKQASVVMRFAELDRGGKINESAEEVLAIVRDFEEDTFKEPVCDEVLADHREAYLAMSARDIVDAYESANETTAIIVDAEVTLDAVLLDTLSAKNIAVYMFQTGGMKKVGSEEVQEVEYLGTAVAMLNQEGFAVRVLSGENNKLRALDPEKAMLFSTGYSEGLLFGKEYDKGLLFSAALSYVLLDKKVLDDKYEGINRPWQKRGKWYEFNIEHASAYGLTINGALARVLDKIKAAISEVAMSRAIKQAA